MMLFKIDLRTTLCPQFNKDCGRFYHRKGSANISDRTLAHYCAAGFFFARLALVADAIFCVWSEGFLAFFGLPSLPTALTAFSFFGFAVLAGFAAFTSSLRKALSGSKFALFLPERRRPALAGPFGRIARSPGFLARSRAVLPSPRGLRLLETRAKSILRSSICTASTRISTVSPRRYTIPEDSPIRRWPMLS